MAAAGTAAVASVGLWILWVVRHPDRLWSMIDLKVLAWGGEMARHHPGALYEGRFDDLLPFLYPPFSALGFAAVDELSFNGLQTLESVTVIVSVFAAVWLTLGMASRLRGDRLPWRARFVGTAVLGGGLFWLEPVQQTLAFGQVSAVLLVMVVADLALDDRRWAKGVLIGVGTGLKLTPGLFIVYLVLTRRFRAAAVATGSLLVTALVGWIVLPEQSRQFWTPGVLSSLSSRIDASDLENQSLYGTVFRLLGTPEAAHRVWVVAAAAVTAVGLAAAVVLHRRYGDLGGMLGAAVVSLLVSPISWTHYWVWVIPALTWGAYRTWTRRQWSGVAPLAAVVALFFAYPARTNPVTGGSDSHLELLPKGLVWSVPQAGQREFGWTPWQHVVGNLYVIFGVAVLAGGVLWLARTRRPMPTRSLLTRPILTGKG